MNVRFEEYPGLSRRALTSGVAALMAFSCVLATLVVPDAVIGAKSFKATMVVSNIVERTAGRI